jgi:hypothetical protein
MAYRTGEQPDGHDINRPGAVERRREPFVREPNLVVYQVDHVTSQRYALAKFDAETRIVGGGQLTRRIVDGGCDLEEEIRERIHDQAQYAAMSVVLSTFLTDAQRWSQHANGRGSVVAGRHLPRLDICQFTSAVRPRPAWARGEGPGR